MASVEERLRALEAANAALSRQLSDLQAREEIGDLMGRYARYFSENRGEQLFTELWSQADPILLEYGASGVFTERWKIQLFYYHDAVPGCLRTVTFSAPEITIGEDGQTAFGRWDALGTETDAGDLSRTPVPADSNRR